MRAVVTLSTLPIAFVSAYADAQQVKQFKDWLVACDNVRSCSAFGFESRDNPSGSYVRITRTGDPAAKPTVGFYFDLDDTVKLPMLRLELSGQASSSVPGAALAAPNGHATLADGDVAGFMAALHTAKSLKMSSQDGAKPVAASEVSMSGAMAALRFMDAQQRRDGGVTALVATGAADANAVPQVPERPVIATRTITQLAAPLPAPPPGVRSSQDCMNSPGADIALIAFRLDRQRVLWGACQDWGAYNADYRFFLAEGSKVVPLAISGFDVPGQKPRPDSRGILIFPALADDKATITSITKDEGLGDCGVASDWGWDGTALRLLQLRAMPMCRGVGSGDWPTLFQSAPR